MYMSVTVIEKISYLLAERVIQNKQRYDQDETISGVTCSGYCFREMLTALD